MRTEQEIREKIRKLTRPATKPQDKGFSETIRNLEADVLRWVLGEKDKLPFE